MVQATRTSTHTEMNPLVNDGAVLLINVVKGDLYDIYLPSFHEEIEPENKKARPVQPIGPKVDESKLLPDQ